MKIIPYGRQEITSDDIEAVVEILRSDHLTQGPIVPEFENQIANYCGAKFGVAVNSATSALHLACLALGLGPGDVIWTTPITFVASANCAKYCGADVDFVDIDPLTYNMSVEKLSAKLEIAKKSGKLPKIVIPVHFSGQSCNMRDIKELGNKYGFKIIEDSSHAIGGKYNGNPIGGCQYSDITVFSFHPVKIITTGEGGMATTNSADLNQKMRLLRSHGITRDLAEMCQPLDDAWYYEQIDLGFNYRLTDLQAALGISQLKRLDDYVDQRVRLAKRYEELLSGVDVILPTQCLGVKSAWHLFVIRIEKDLNNQNRRRQLFKFLRKNEIGVNVHYIPVHTQPYYCELGKKMGYTKSSFPEALKYYDEAISLPIFPLLSDKDQEKVVDLIKDFFKGSA